LFSAGYYKRWKWSPIKSRKLVLDVINWGMSADSGTNIAVQILPTKSS
jgi:hypothetical protein